MDGDERLPNTFEHALLEKLLHGDHPVLTALRTQLAACHVISREFTGHGFFTNLDVDRSAGTVAASPARIQIRDVGGTIRGLTHGAGFVLFVTGGYLDCLEGFSYDEPWPPEISEFSFVYEGKRADDPGAIGPTRTRGQA